MVWFVIALGLFCRDSYRQVFRWLKRFDVDAGTPGRSTMCIARQRYMLLCNLFDGFNLLREQLTCDINHALFSLW